IRNNKRTVEVRLCLSLHIAHQLAIVKLLRFSSQYSRALLVFIAQQKSFMQMEKYRPTTSRSISILHIEKLIVWKILPSLSSHGWQPSRVDLLFAANSSRG